MVDAMSRRCRLMTCASSARGLWRRPLGVPLGARLRAAGPPGAGQVRGEGPSGVLAVVLGVVLLWGPFASRGADVVPEPTLLFRGVESVRQQIPPSRLVLRADYRAGIETSVLELLVEFDDDKYGFSRTKTGPEVRAIFDGKQILHYDGVNSVTLRDLRDTTADYLFDPRLLGITADFVCGQSLDDALPYRAATNLQTVCREQVGDRPTWHVRLADTNTYNRRIDIWVDPERNFRVYRYEYSLEGGRPSTVLSFYEDQKYPWLPSRVETQTYDSKAQPADERKLEILKAEPNVRLPDSAWGLAGLRPPAGTEVQDRRIRSRIGYWNGAALVPSPGKIQPAVTTSRPRALVIIMLCATAVAGLLLLLRFRRTEA